MSNFSTTQGISNNKSSILTKLVGLFKRTDHSDGKVSHKTANQVRSQAYYDHFDPAQDENYKYITFTFCFIALAAALIKADAPANQEELEVLLTLFPPPRNDLNQITDIFFAAYMDNTAYAKYANKMLQFFGSDPVLYQKILDNLIDIAIADGYLNKSELVFLSDVMKIFALSQNQLLASLRAALITRQTAYQLLQLPSKFSSRQLHQAYRQQASLYHPDTWLKHQDVAAPFLEIMNEKFQLLTNAFDQLRK